MNARRLPLLSLGVVVLLKAGRTERLPLAWFSSGEGVGWVLAPWNPDWAAVYPAGGVGGG